MVKINKKYNKFIPLIIEWFSKTYCTSENNPSVEKVYLKRILEEYDNNYKAYENGKKEFIIEKKYLYSLKEAVYQAISDKYCSDDLLSEFKDFLDEEYNKWRK